MTVELVVRHIPEYGWGLFHKGTTRKAEGNEFGPWYATRKAALDAKARVAASIERAAEAEPCTACEHHQIVRARLSALVASLSDKNERLRDVLRRLLDGEYGMDVAPDGAIACASLRIYNEARDEAVALLAESDGVRGIDWQPSRGNGPSGEACTSGSIPAPCPAAGDDATQPANLARQAASVGVEQVTGSSPEAAREGERRPAGGAPKQRPALPSPSPGDRCPQSLRQDGNAHSWTFDGDDPRIICAFCDEMRDAISGQVLRAGYPDDAEGDQ